MYKILITFWLSENQHTRIVDSFPATASRTLNTAVSSHHVELCLASSAAHWLHHTRAMLDHVSSITCITCITVNYPHCWGGVPYWLYPVVSQTLLPKHNFALSFWGHDQPITPCTPTFKQNIKASGHKSTHWTNGSTHGYYLTYNAG